MEPSPALEAQRMPHSSLPRRLAYLAAAGALVAVYLAYAFSPQGFIHFRHYGLYDSLAAWLEVIQPELLWYLVFTVIAVAVSSLLIAAIRNSKAEAAGGRFLTMLEERPLLLREVWLMMLAVLAVFFCSALSHHGTPLTDDEWVYRFQAQVLASGSLTAPLQGPAEFFKNQYLVVTDRIYSQYPFGHAALLVPGVLVGYLQLMPLLLGGIAILFVHRLAELLTNRRQALLVTGLLLTSPQFLLTQGTTASQSSIVAIGAAYAYFFVRGAQQCSVGSAFAAGLLWGWGLQTRPIDMLLLSAALGVLLLQHRASWRDPRFLRMLGALVAGGLLSGGLYLGTNWLVNGGPFTTNYNPLWKDHPSGATSAFGFGMYPWGIVHTPWRGLLQTVINFIRMNFWLLGSPLSWLLAAAGLRRRSLRSIAWPIGLMTAATFVTFFFYFWPGMSDTGPAYYHFLLPFLTLLAVAGLTEQHERNADRPQRLRAASPTTIAAVISLVSLALFLPVQCGALAEVTARIREPYEVIRKAVPGPALVFTPFYFYVTSRPKAKETLLLQTPLIGLRNNDPKLSDQIIFVRDLKERNHEMTARFPDRVALLFQRLGSGAYALTPLDNPDAKVILHAGRPPYHEIPGN